jgi:small subunit ribosomal protein S1
MTDDFAPAHPTTDTSSTPTSPAAATGESSGSHPSLRRRIGSQRPGSPKIEAKPQVQPVQVKPLPTAQPSATDTQPAEAESQPQPVDAQPVESRPVEPQRHAKPKHQSTPTPTKTAVPNIREKLAPEDELELAAAMGEGSFDEMLDPTGGAAKVVELQPDSRHTATVITIHQDDVFVDLGGPHQGVMSLRQLAEVPAIGSQLPVIVHRFNPDEGLYAVSTSGQTVAVEDWSQVSEGMIVEARVTGHNKGGLECEVNSLRGFIPASQVAAYRVEDLAQFVGEKFTCVVTEAKPEKRNLVLSRRAVLEREREAAREQALASLAEGQIVEGVVRSLRDFGAFVDIGGVDGLVHISQLSWQRVKHPSDVLEVGQKVRVMIRKIDPETGKIGLAMRDLVESPWASVGVRFPVSTVVRGKVTKIMDFGAFVELEPGIEGLVHISELSHGRVFRVRDIVNEGDTVEAKILAIDPEEQRISLSMKAIQARPEPKRAEREEELPEEPAAPLPPSRHKNLKGGIQRPAGGEKFGLKW